MRAGVRLLTALAISQTLLAPLTQPCADRAEAEDQQRPGARFWNGARNGGDKASLDVILTLQSEAASSEIEYLNEISTGRFNTYRILAVTGRLLPALGIRYADGGSQ